MSISTILTELQTNNVDQPTFLQAAEEFLISIAPYAAAEQFTAADYDRLRRLLVPEQIHQWRVDWTDDNGSVQTNLGYRVQYNSALGPYKGGLRFDPTVNVDVLKFLGLEQTFKNALTGLRLGSAKGGSDFDPKGKSDRELRSFTHAFMLGLHRHIGIDIDVPAGDIGVGGREIGYLYGAYKQITGNNEGVLTGKDELFGGSCGRVEATGHGVVYLAEAAAKQHDLALRGMRAVVSGSGNVAEHTARKLLELGVTVLTLSDRQGYIHKPSGLTTGDIAHIVACRQNGMSLAEIAIADAHYETGKVWGVEADAYFPCATQNELDRQDAEQICDTAKLIVEGANMPLTNDAVTLVQERNIVFVPGKAANAGGVSVSGIEMAQNAGHYRWSCEAVESELKRIMEHIHAQCVAYGQTETGIDYVKGANVAGFRRVFVAMQKLGW